MTLFEIMSPITLTRAEAVVVSSLLLWTDGGCLFSIDATNPEGVEAAIRRLRLEAAIRDGGGWWEHNGPGMLDMHAKLREDGYPEYIEAICPETFTLPANATRALAELLPIAFGDTLDGDVETVRALAARLGVELEEQIRESEERS